MKAFRFESFYRALLILLALGLFWSVWVRAADPSASTAAATNAVAATNTAAGGTNAAPEGLPHLGVQLLPTIDRQYLTFGLDEIPYLRDSKFLGIALWQYIASFIFIFLAFYVAKFLDYLTRIWLKRWAEKTETQVDDMLLELANGPVKVVAFVVFLHIGLSVFEWPPTVERWLASGLKIIVALSITYAILKVVDIAVGAWRERTGPDADKSFDQQLTPIVRKALKAVVVIVATLVTLDNVGINITGLIASLSIGGLALGLAAQDTVANLFGAVAVLVDKPFKVGDRVQFESVDGVVETIGLRSTRVRNLDGFLVTVPNKTMGNATITNVTSRPTIRTVFNIGLTYDTPVQKVELATKILDEVIRQHPGTHDVLIGFNKFVDSALNIQVVHWWKDTDYKAYLRGMQAMNLEIKRRFDADGLNFAFPTQTLYLKQDSDLRFQVSPS
ncbi:MAG: mechanosensitive ion channel family protein [Verrucomicrobiales bacterium]|nr:mechanosensitive ion channel family protein [Verrucomicrobiales bacterium]